MVWPRCGSLNDRGRRASPDGLWRVEGSWSENLRRRCSVRVTLSKAAGLPRLVWLASLPNRRDSVTRTNFVLHSGKHGRAGKRHEHEQTNRLVPGSTEPRQIERARQM